LVKGVNEKVKDEVKGKREMLLLYTQYPIPNTQYPILNTQYAIRNANLNNRIDGQPRKKF